MFYHICRLRVVRWSIEEYSKAHSTDYRKPLEISHWEALVHMKKLLEWPMYASLSLESDKHVIAGENTEALDKANGSAARHRIGV